MLSSKLYFWIISSSSSLSSIFLAFLLLPDSISHLITFVNVQHLKVSLISHNIGLLFNSCPWFQKNTTVAISGPGFQRPHHLHIFCPLSSYHRTSSFCLKNSSTSIMFASVTSILVGVLECLFYNPMLYATPGTEPFLFSFWIVHCLVNKQSYQSQLLIFY